MTVTPPWGLKYVVPEQAIAAWGARMIVTQTGETDMLWEKLSFLAPLALLTTHAEAPAGVVRTQRRGELETVIA